MRAAAPAASPGGGRPQRAQRAGPQRRGVKRTVVPSQGRNCTVDCHPPPSTGFWSVVSYCCSIVAARTGTPSASAIDWQRMTPGLSARLAGRGRVADPELGLPVPLEASAQAAQPRRVRGGEVRGPHDDARRHLDHAARHGRVRHPAVAEDDQPAERARRPGRVRHRREVGVGLRGLRDGQEPVGCGIVVVAQLVRARRVADRAARRRRARKRLVVDQKRPGHADAPSVLDIFVPRAGPDGHPGVPGPGGAVLPPSPGWASSGRERWRE